MKSSLLVVLAVFSFANSAGADPYHRFWRGTKLADMSESEFQKGLNETFVPQTIQTGAAKGLIAYQPVLSEGTSPLLPDEIALVSYRDQAAYDAIRATQQGQDYAALHWKYFERSRSSSVVPQAYAGAIALEHAYDLHPEFDGWMSAGTHLKVQYKNSGESDADYLQRIKTEIEAAKSDDAKNAIEDRIYLVAENYWLEYIAKKTLTLHVAANPIVTDMRQFGGAKAKNFPIEHQPLKTAKLKPGSGLNVQF